MSEDRNINELFEDAQEEGLLSPESSQALMVHDIGQQIQDGLGVSIDDVEASEVVLVSVMVDDSGSIRMAGNSQPVRDGHNEMLKALTDSKQQDNVLVHTRFLNGSVLYPYCSLDQAIEMDKHNYNPIHGTPLYDEMVSFLGTVLAKTFEFADNGVPVRTISLIMTDGHDQHSVRHNASAVKNIVNDMLGQENHIVAAMGFDDGGITDFRDIFGQMGLLNEWILTPQNTPSEIRKAFQLFSKSAVQASQSSMNFSKTAMGGFGG